LNSVAANISRMFSPLNFVKVIMICYCHSQMLGVSYILELCRRLISMKSSRVSAASGVCIEPTFRYCPRNVGSLESPNSAGSPSLSLPNIPKNSSVYLYTYSEFIVYFSDESLQTVKGIQNSFHYL